MQNSNSERKAQYLKQMEYARLMAERAPTDLSREEWLALATQWAQLANSAQGRF